MKKLVFVLIIGLLIGTAAFADHPGGLGIGAVFGGGWGVHGYDVYPGLSLKLSGIPFFWGLYPHISQWGFGFGVTGDFYLREGDFITKTATNEDGTYDVNIDWYLGVGFMGNINLWDDGTAIDIGARIPLGVSWHALKQFEVALGIVPGLGLYIGSGGPAFFWVFPVEMILRFWP